MYCSKCGKENADTAAFCASCGSQMSGAAVQPSSTPAMGGAELASIGRRLGALLLDGVIEILTLYVGWVIWSFLVYGRGQTPGKQLVGIYVALVAGPERRLSWGSMFLREIVVKALLFGLLLNAVTLGIAWIIDNLWALWDGTGHNQTLHDKVVKTSVYRVQNN